MGFHTIYKTAGRTATLLLLALTLTGCPYYEANILPYDTSGKLGFAIANNIANRPLKVTSARTLDLNKNGKLDTIEIEFNKAVDDRMIQLSSIDVLIYSGETVAPGANGDVSNNNIIYLSILEKTEPCGNGSFRGCDTDVKPLIKIDKNFISDLYGNQLSSATSVITAKDGAPPLLVAAFAEKIRRKLLLVFSEPVYGQPGALPCELGGEISLASFLYHDNDKLNSAQLTKLTNACGIEHERILAITNSVFQLSDLNNGDQISVVPNSIFDGSNNQAPAIKIDIREKRGPDFNGDGVADFVAGAKNGLSESGLAYLFFGSLSSGEVIISDDADFRFQGKNIGDRLGVSSTTAGDFNNDGFDDLLVGASHVTESGNTIGAAYLFSGSTLDPGLFPIKPLIEASNALLTIKGTVANGDFGVSVTGGGDLNGDGIDDIAIGSQRHCLNPLLVNCGSVHIFYGKNSAGGSSTADAADLIISSAEEGALFGHRLKILNDFNGDHNPDLVVGAPGSSNFSGKVFIYYSSLNQSGTIDSVVKASRTILGENPNDRLGNFLTGAGDYNGDGRSDLLLGAARENLPGEMTGQAYLFWGSNQKGAILAADAPVIFTGSHADGRFGASLTSLGDLNQDGFDDIAIGAPNASTGGNIYNGEVTIFAGSSQSEVRSSATADITIQGSVNNNFFGSALNGKADLNYDGNNALLIGSPLACDSGSNQGKVFRFDNLLMNSTLSDTDADAVYSGTNNNFFFGEQLAN